MQWLKLVEEFANAEGVRSRLTTRFCDLGEIGSWGRPKTYHYRHLFSEYTDFLWNQEKTPDLVLVDGRFRVCSFLTCCKKAPPGTKIIFDDYLERPEYHVVEEYLKPLKVDARQALFVIPDKKILDMDRLDSDIERFRFVMD